MREILYTGSDLVFSKEHLNDIVRHVLVSPPLSLSKIPR